MVDMTRMKTVAKARVKQGAKFLDRSHKDWFLKIDLKILDLDDCMDCVLGQLYGEYRFGRAALNGPTLPWGDYGFDVPCEFLSAPRIDLYTAYSEYTKLWKAEVKERRARHASKKTRGAPKL